MAARSHACCELYAGGACRTFEAEAAQGGEPEQAAEQVPICQCLLLVHVVGIIVRQAKPLQLGSTRQRCPARCSRLCRQRQLLQPRQPVSWWQLRVEQPRNVQGAAPQLAKAGQGIGNAGQGLGVQ